MAKSNHNIFQDWAANKSNIKGRLVLAAFRVAHWATINKLFFILFIPYSVLYRLVVEWFLCIELPFKTTLGKNTRLYHGHATVINDGCIIGNNCTIRHCTTIGNKQLNNNSFSSCPIIGNNVDIGSNVCIIGPLTIGNNVTIGAGSVIVKSIPDNCIVVGNPGRVIKTNSAY
jgi:putative colanic acid biosynthesis acetyltransferase WcaB